MRNFPAPWTVWLHRYDATARNAHNVPIKAYVPARDVTGEPVKVIQWEIDKSRARDADQTVEKVTLFVPAVLTDPDGNQVDLPKTTDLVDVPHADGVVRQFEITGIHDYNHGFHGWSPGYMIDLQRATP